MKLAEYLAAGRAVVGSAIPGISEMLAETGGGITVPPHDPVFEIEQAVSFFVRAL